MQSDQHRRPAQPTAGITGEQAKSDWLSLLPVVVQRLVHYVCRAVESIVIPPLAVVIWIQRYASVHRARIADIFRGRPTIFIVGFLFVGKVAGNGNS